METWETVTMSRKEARRPGLVQLAVIGTITTAEGARNLKLTRRQFRRLKARYRAAGVRGLVHRLRGRPSPRAVAAEIRDRVLALIQTTYREFNDCHCTEKLREVEGLAVSRDTVRRLRRALGLPPKRRRRPPQHRTAAPGIRPWAASPWSTAARSTGSARGRPCCSSAPSTTPPAPSSRSTSAPPRTCMAISPCCSSWPSGTACR
jgi:transposase